MPRVAPDVTELRCIWCGDTHRLSFFRRYPSGLYSTECRFCMRVRAREWFRKNRKKGSYARGERHPRAKKKWFDICILRSNPHIPGNALGRLLGINSGTVSYIRRGLLWRTQR